MGRDLFVQLSDKHRMGSTTSSFARNRHVVCFQEVHGNMADILLSFTRWLPGWLIVRLSCCDSDGFDDPAFGAVVIAICSMLRGLCPVEDRAIVPGRCLSVTLCSDSSGLHKRVHILNLHNYGFTGGQVSAVGAVLDIFFKMPCLGPKRNLELSLETSMSSLGMTGSSKLVPRRWVPRYLLIIIQALGRQLG